MEFLLADDEPMINEPFEDGLVNIGQVLLAEDRGGAGRSDSGETALHLVRNPKTAVLLISKGADIDSRDKEFGMTPLFNANVRVSEVLLAKGADLEATSNEGHTPLAWAAYWDDLEKSLFLLQKGASVNAGAGKTKTALHIAANWGRIELARLLIAHGADVNARDGSGWTPLHWAAFEGGPEMVRFLISCGAAVDARTNVFRRFAGALFVDPARGDWRPTPDAARTAAVPAEKLRAALAGIPVVEGTEVQPLPGWQYRHPTDKAERPSRERVTLGALEP
mgnify:CR=1 FL=1